MDPVTSAVVLAAGASRRMGGRENKNLMDLGGCTVLEHSLTLFARLSEVKEIVLVIAEADWPLFDGALNERVKQLGVKKIVTGGPQRFDSSANGVAACGEECELVLIHDGARPFPPEKRVREAIAKAAEAGGAILATPLTDTLKRAGAGGVIVSTLSREGLFRAQTPQVFRKALFEEALASARERKLSPTDDALVMEAAGNVVHVIDGGPSNIKITTQEDLVMARALLQTRRSRGAML